MAKLDPKLKKKWVRALRSGKYEQGQSHLKFHGRYCCLGVLAEIQGYDFEGYIGDTCTTNLPKGFNAGLTCEQRTFLGLMNDGADQGPRSFIDIADYIEERL